MKKSEKLFFAAGFLAICILFVPWLVLGNDAVVTYHDQLDGEMIAYILQAKHLAKGSVLPEFMNGAAKTALTPPAPLSVLLFLGGNYEWALFLMQLIGSLTGYVGMFLLAKDVTGKTVPSVIAAGLYGVLPFLPVYGFSQYGLPLLLYCILQLKKGRLFKFSLVYGLMFALNSSLALVGVSVLLVYGGMLVWELSTKSVGKRRIIGQSVLWLVLLLGYLLTNLQLLKQVLGIGETAVSHKSEYRLVAENFWESWVNGLFYGGQHSQDYHLAFAVAGVVVFTVFVWKWGLKDSVIRTGLCALFVNVVLAFVAAVWNSGVGVAIKSHFGALGAFQLDRLLWISPCLWYLFLACCLALVLRLFSKEEWVGKQVLITALCTLFMVIALGITGLQILKNSDVKSNIQKLRNPQYPVMSYGDYYAIGVYEQVEEFLAGYTGLEQSDYRVVSLGIDPAAALYHGFYCLDGYSNNYSLAYKHDFRKVIEPALQESDYLRAYYDEWGNRCYLFGSECPGYYTIEKNGFYFSHLELNTDALRELGGNYLFSAAYIANARELGLVLLNEEAFETPDSYYRIFVYEVQKP